MSVSTYPPAAFASLAGDYKYINPVLAAYAPTPEHFNKALVALHFANKAAFCMQYGWAAAGFEDVKDAIAQEPLHGIMRFGKAQDEDRIATMRAMVPLLDNMLYNTVTNDGADFLPAMYRAILRDAHLWMLKALAGYIA